MFSLLQQTAPVVVEHSETVVSTETAQVAAHGADAAHVATAADAAHGASSAGMPQLDISTFGNQIVWLLLVLAAIYWVLSRVALPRIGGIISDRQGAITGDLMAAEEFKQKAKDAEAAYDKALADARAEANKIIAANKAEMHKELDAAIAHADAEIAARSAESEKRIGEIRATAVEDARAVARDVTESLVQNFGGSVDQNLINDAVDQRLKGALQ
ncbi:F0F1 ATP synthase subunit B' [Paracoccus sp. PAR01]|uniref:F0F1 ATP synthase subunit B' n=1 Tax=Paracoccus sp. PAR01 TaxID=2769282 RepID=UPI001782B01E|nr:F0F1 ATP synthase subunit B' [Paracoccus sp. PAR01]MBD9525567.1 F0F1 ATP synthase subunit B' [Paracoccus sp. PAR01]